MNSEKGCLEENSNKGGGRLLIQGGDYISLYLSLSIYIYICIYIYIYIYIHIISCGVNSGRSLRDAADIEAVSAVSRKPILYYTIIQYNIL